MNAAAFLFHDLISCTKERSDLPSRGCDGADHMMRSHDQTLVTLLGNPKINMNARAKNHKQDGRKNHDLIFGNKTLESPHQQRGPGRTVLHLASTVGRTGSGS